MKAGVSFFLLNRRPHGGETMFFMNGEDWYSVYSPVGFKAADAEEAWEKAHENLG